LISRDFSLVSRMMATNQSRRKSHEGEEAKTASWMVTFSDLSTLLLTFFVLLLSMSSMDDLKLKSYFHNFTGSCGILLFKEQGEIYRPKEVLIEGLYEQLKDALIAKLDRNETEDEVVSDLIENPYAASGNEVIFQNTDDGLKLTFGQEILFNPGSAEVKEAFKPVLSHVAKFIRLSHYQIYIDGHTDNVPIHNERFSSNDALSLARAYAVLEYLIKVENLPPDFIAIAGYGEKRPLAPNNSAAARALNRRVEMIFKNQQYF
jgi:chemotaxis protein MotB